MARKGKIGIDYFSHDVDILQDKKIKLIKAKHGLIGYAIYLRLLEEIYRDTGYYLQLDENFNILFSDDNKIELNEYILILNDCINIDLFNKKIYEKYNIITSKRIQLNYFSGTERRKEVEFIKEYLIIDPLLNYKTDKVNVNIISLNVDINALNADIGTQSKGKESKVEEKEISRRVIDKLNELGNKSFRYGKNNTENIIARLRENFTEDDCLRVLEIKAKDQYFMDNPKHYNPITLFRPKNFEKYLNELPKKEKETIVICLDRDIWKNSRYQAGGLWETADIIYTNFKPDFIDDDEREEVELNTNKFIEEYCDGGY